VNTRFIYILIALVAVILYELYLIGFYKYQDFQTNTYIESLDTVNTEMSLRNASKEKLNLYIRTKAYQGYVAKATQNKKLAGEEVTNVVDEASMKGNENIDVSDVLFQIQKKEDSPTKNMTNQEKWWYILSNVGEYF
jgi:hypothetical protein